MTNPNTPSVRHPLWQVADQLQMDLRAASAKLVELRAQLAALSLPELAEPDLHECEFCGQTFRSEREFEEHRYHHHNGPLPSMWALADERAGET